MLRITQKGLSRFPEAIQKPSIYSLHATCTQLQRKARAGGEEGRTKTKNSVPPHLGTQLEKKIMQGLEAC